MPRRDLGPGGKPFEVKGGLGFNNFGGMYNLGDPSMSAPNRPQRLINVRLGEKDIKSRPGLDATWDSGTGDAVVGMIEIQRAESGKIFVGPYQQGRQDDVVAPWLEGMTYDPATDTLFFMHYFVALQIAGGDTALDPLTSGRTALFYIPYTTVNVLDWDFDDPSLLQSICQIFSTRERVLAGCSHGPYYYAWDKNGAFGTVPLPAQSCYILSPFATDDAEQPIWRSSDHTTVAYFSHSHYSEVAFSSGGVDWHGSFPDDKQWGPCLDPPRLFRGKWIFPGSVVSHAMNNPGVLGQQSAGTAGTGQQMFEILFDAKNIDPPTPLVDILDNGGPNAPTVVYGEGNRKAFFGGSLTELFRMPGVSYATIPTRAAGGMDGKTIRSMTVREVRKDNPITADQATDQILYMGTHGGYPIVAAAFQSIPPAAPGTETLIPPYGTLTNGEVYSFDGTTVKLETTGLGPAVVVTALPDGAILACGRTAAKMLDPATNTWVAVTYNPTYATDPRSIPQPGVNPLTVPAISDPSWHSKGFIWTDRVIFKGEAYYIGWDTARLCLSTLTNAIAPLVGPNLDYPSAPGSGWVRGSTRDCWVLYRFDRATLTMVRVRNGEDIFTALTPTYWPTTVPAYDSSLQFQMCATSSPGWPCLAVWGQKLHYNWMQTVKLIGVAAVRNWQGIGTYDGTTWDDDAVYAEGGEVTAAIDHYHFSGGEADDLGGLYGMAIMDMCPTSSALFIAMKKPLGNGAGIFKWNGTTLAAFVTPVNNTSTVRSEMSLRLTVGGRMFVGPS